MGGWLRVLGICWALSALAGTAGAAGVSGSAEAADWVAPSLQRPAAAPRAKIFGVPGGCNGYIYSMVAAPSGLIYVGGDFSVCEEVLASSVAAYDPRTRRFHALGSGSANGVSTGSFGGVYTLVLDGDDLIAGGIFDAAGGRRANGIARWNGSAWESIGSGDENGVQGQVYDLVVHAGQIYVGGLFTHAGSVPAASVARWDGSAWHALGSGVGGRPDASVYALTVSGNDIWFGGLFTTAGGNPASYLARWNGSAWSEPGGGVDGEVNELSTIGSEVYAGGAFARAGGVLARQIARWNGSAWSALGSGLDGRAMSIIGDSAELIVGGQFNRAGEITANNVARWNGSTWSAYGAGSGEGVNSTVWALAQSAGALFAGGYFDHAGGVPANFLARWDGQAWSAPGAGGGNGVNNVIAALALSGSQLYAGGFFTQAGGQPSNFVARWNGSRWNALGSGEGNGVGNPVLALATFGSDVYAGGYFRQAGGADVGYIARWDGSNWSALAGGVGGNSFPAVLAIEPIGDALYVGGDFIEAGGQPAFKIARWDGTTWSSLGTGDANGVERGDFVSVHAIVGRSANEVYVGGNFTRAGGVPAVGVARWNGSSWSALGNGIVGRVYALALVGDSLYVGGDLSEAGGRTAYNIARWDGSNWSPLGSEDTNGVLGGVLALEVVGSDLYVGGRFDFAGGEPANGLARWDGTRWHGLAVDAPPQVVYALAADAGSLYAGGAGLTQTPLPDLQSIAAGGAVANGASQRSAIARTGSRVAFASDASNLVAGDGNGRSDVFVRDPISGTVTRASAAAEAINGGAAESFADPALSADGSRVAFGGSTGQVYAVVGGVGRLLSRSASGALGDAPSGKVHLPGNGSLAVFESRASNLLATADSNGVSDIYTTDLATGVVSLVTRAPDGSAANGASSGPWSSDDGQVIAFSTLATNLVPSTATPKNGTIRQATVMRGGGLGQTRYYVSRNLSTGALGNGDSTNVRLTPDGRYGVFESLASNLVEGDTNGVADIFRFELNEARTAMVRLERVSTSRYGFEANGPSRNPSLCDDGQFVGFDSEASNLIELDRNGQADILIKWLVTGEIVRLSRTVDGNQPNGSSTQPYLSGDCSTIVFGSAASNLAANDNNNVPDVFSVTLRERTPAVVTGPQDEPGLSAFALPAPDPANPSCPAGFFIASAEDGPGSGLTRGLFGMEVLLDDPGTRVLAGGLNFGGLIDAGQPGFAGFNFANAANEPQRLNLRVTGSPASNASGSLPVRIRIERRPDANTSVTVFEATTSLTLANAYTNTIDLPPGFYAATVAATAGSAGGEADGQFFFELTTSFVNRPGGGFQGGAVVGGYHAAHPFGGVSGFAAFCLATPHSTSIRVLSRPSYGPSGAQDLKLKLKDAQQRELVVVPAG